jgi:uncharacterized protein (TIGR02145 family)
MIGIPTSQLEDFTWRGTNEGGMLKSTVGWAAPNLGATNSTGFNAIPAGNGRSANNIYTTFGSEDYYYDAGFWSKSATDSETAIARSLRFDGSAIYRFISDKNAGLSIRCLKD